MLSQRRQWSKACAGAGGVTGKSLLIEQECFGAATKSNIKRNKVGAPFSCLAAPFFLKLNAFCPGFPWEHVRTSG